MVYPNVVWMSVLVEMFIPATQGAKLTISIHHATVNEVSLFVWLQSILCPNLIKFEWSYILMVFLAYRASTTWTGWPIRSCIRKNRFNTAWSTLSWHLPVGHNWSWFGTWKERPLPKTCGISSVQQGNEHCNKPEFKSDINCGIWRKMIGYFMLYWY